jgi:FkbM family methyltransferase
MASDTTLTLVDGVRVAVPDSLELITPYVLREQQDWFEDEIRFLRRLLLPGQKVLDIGASYGVYALSMARTVGAAGAVVAFEPAAESARLLEAAIAENAFGHVTLRRSAVSAAAGTGRMSLHPHPELSALLHGKEARGATETVAVTTLDECMRELGWRDIAFVKIDAEGEEAEILRGGERFFAELSPLVQYEVKAGDDLHLELVRDFAARGYDSYRLVPGLDLLVPFDAGSPPDPYLLNLFCCKPDRAGALAGRGRLLERTAAAQPRSAASSGKEAYGWRRALAAFPYAARLASRWEQAPSEGCAGRTAEALALYALSRDPSAPAVERFHGLEACLERLSVPYEREPSQPRLASLARAARDFGKRSQAVGALVQLCDGIARRGDADASEPFLAPCERFEAIPPGEDLWRWMLAAALEELERLGSFSSFYTGASARPRLDMIRDLGFGSAEMRRRLDLVQQRFGPPAR